MALFFIKNDLQDTPYYRPLKVAPHFDFLQFLNKFRALNINTWRQSGSVVSALQLGGVSVGAVAVTGVGVGEGTRCVCRGGGRQDGAMGHQAGFVGGGG